MTYRLSAFDFELPNELVAQTPAPRRSGSRLLQVDANRFRDRMFDELPELLSPGDLLVFNDTRVVHSRLRGRKPSALSAE